MPKSEYAPSAQEAGRPGQTRTTDEDSAGAEAAGLGYPSASGEVQTTDKIKGA